MNRNSETFRVLQQMVEDGGNSSELYRDMIRFIQEKASDKNIEFDGFFKSKWKSEADFPVTFDSDYFDNAERSALFVYLAALSDEEVYSWVKYAYDETHIEKLSENILHREIYYLKEKGIKF